MSNLIDFSLYDEATDGFFTVKVSAAWAGELFHGAGAVFKQPKTCTGAVPKQNKAQWSIAMTKRLLKECSKPSVRSFLRQKKVALEIYEEIAMEMSKFQPAQGMEWQVTGIQVRERMRYLKSCFSKAKQAQNDWEYSAAMRYIFDAPPDARLDASLDESVEPNSSRPPMGETYVVADPKYVTSAGSKPMGTTYVVENPKYVTSENMPPPLGTTYIVHHPKFVTGIEQNSTAASHTDYDSVELPAEALEDIDPSILKMCTFFSPDGRQIPAPNNLFSNETETEMTETLQEHDEPNPIEVEEEDLNTTMLQSSTLPSETFFVRNLNLKSTPENSGALQSPAKKKTTNGEVGSRRTPRSTPRRKKRYQTEAWLPGLTDAFLKECVKQKEKVQTGTPPSSVWKEVAENLGHAGFTCEWQACREKFESMNLFFERSLLKVNGVIGQTPWPYYDYFLEIHDLPKGYIQPEDTPEPNQDHEDLEDSKMWNKTTIPLLISLYKERRHLFKSTKSGIRHTSLYREISAVMKLFNYDRSYKQCQRKMNSMLQYFRKEFDNENRTGEAPSTWEWFKLFMEMEKGSANLIAPFAFSTGAVTQYSIQGSERALAEKRSTRTRTTANVTSLTTREEEQADDPNSSQEKSVKVKNPPKKKLYKNWTQDVQEKSVQAKKDMVEEVRLLRLTQVETNAPKNEALKTMAEAMVNISTYCRSLTK